MTSRQSRQWVGLSHSVQKDPSITVTHLTCVDFWWPQGSGQLFLSGPFTPNQRQIRASLHDKVLWKSRQRKERGPFQLLMGEKILCLQGGFDHMVLNSKRKVKLGLLDSFPIVHIKQLYITVVQTTDLNFLKMH